MNQKKSNRAKYASRPFRLVSADTVERAIAAIRNAPIDQARPLEVVIREQPKRRSGPQNSLYWALLHDISEQVWLGGRTFPEDVWHEQAKRNLMPNMVTTPDGAIRSKWDELPDGTTAVMSTTGLSVESFAEFITAVEVYGAEMGVQFSVKEYA